MSAAHPHIEHRLDQDGRIIYVTLTANPTVEEVLSGLIELKEILDNSPVGICIIHNMGSYTATGGNVVSRLGRILYTINNHPKCIEWCVTAAKMSGLNMILAQAAVKAFMLRKVKFASSVAEANERIAKQLSLAA